MSDSPIFIVSSERSGSNLLRVLLSNHSRLHGPVAPHFLANFAPLVPFYGDFGEGGASSTLLRDMLRVANHEQYDWKLELRPFPAPAPPSLMACFDLLYRTQAARHGKRRFVCKENRLFDFVPELDRYYSGAKFIYLYRDPRAYAASWLKVPLGIQSVYAAARHWVSEQSAALLAFAGFQHGCFSMAYEELVADTRGVMRRLLAYVEEEPEEACFQSGADLAQEAARSPYWKNLNKPVDSAKAGRFAQELSPHQMRIVESVARDYMHLLGYPLATAADWKPSSVFLVRDKISQWWRARRQRASRDDGVVTLRDRGRLGRQIAEERRSQAAGRIPAGPWN